MRTFIYISCLFFFISVHGQHRTAASNVAVTAEYNVAVNAASNVAVNAEPDVAVKVAVKTMELVPVWKIIAQSKHSSETAGIARLYRRQNTRVRRALTFSTYRSRPAMA